MLALVLVTLMGCEPIEPSTDIAQLAQARVQADVAQVTPPPTAEPVVEDSAPEPAVAEVETEDGFDFDADAPEPATEDGAEMDDAALMEGFGIDVTPEEEAYPADMPLLEPAPEPSAPPLFPEDTPASNRWTPDQPVVLTGAVRLISTTAQSQPPRAILGLADGTEVVVEPGTMLPDAHIVVLAVGEDAVQVAEITPMGDRARMDSRILQAMYSQNRSQR